MTQATNHRTQVTMPTEPTTTLELVTPGIAQQWLTANTDNRPLRAALVNRLARDMSNGDWHLTGDPVQFATDGRLIDGQHRLSAVVASGETVRMFVTRGLAGSAQQFIDQGMARTAADALSLGGYGNANVLAAAARVGVLVDSGALYTTAYNQKVSHAQILDWVSDHPDMVEAVRFGMGTPQKNAQLRPSVLTYCYYRLAEVSPDDAGEFFSRLGGGHDLANGSPILALSSRLTQLAISGQRPNTRHMISMVFRAWNAWRKGRRMTQIPLVMKNATALPDPA